MSVPDSSEMDAENPRLKCVRPWCNRRTLAKSDQWLAVDKPAAVAQGESSSDSLSSRLAREGLGAWGRQELPRGFSGACWLGPPSASSAEGDSFLSGVVREVVIAVDDYRGGPSGQFGTHSFRLCKRGVAGATLCFTTRASPTDLAADLGRAGCCIAGMPPRLGLPVGTRPLVHVRTVRLPGKPTVKAALPSEFDAWLSGGAVRPPEQFEPALLEAGVARYGVSERRGVYRLLAESSGEIAGLTIDTYGGYCVVATSSEEAVRVVPELADCLMDQGALGVYVKHRARRDLRQQPPEVLAPPRPIAGEVAPDPLPLSVGPVKLQLRLGDGHSTGVFLDQAANWPRVAELVSGGALLNLFCYTGAFTVFAAAAGAAATTSVDLSGRALTRLSENLSLNGLSGRQHQLRKADALKWLQRAGRRAERFDVVVLDPPSFGTRARGVLSLRRDYELLVDQSLHLLSSGGKLLSVVHHRGLDSELLVDTVRRAATKHSRRVQVQGLAGDWDCPTLPGVSPTKNVLCSLLST